MPRELGRAGAVGFLSVLVVVAEEEFARADRVPGIGAAGDSAPQLVGCSRVKREPRLRHAVSKPEVLAKPVLADAGVVGKRVRLEAARNVDRG